MIRPLRLRTRPEQAMDDMLDRYVGRRLRWRRRLLGLSQTDLADRIGVRFQQIQKYEAAANRVSAARLWLIAGALGVDVQYFFEGWVDKRGDAPRGTSLLRGRQDRERQSQAA